MAGIGYNNRLDEGFPTMGSPERQLAWARDRASRGRYSPERSPGDVLPAIGFGIYDALKERGAFTPSAGPDVPFGGSQAARNVVVAEQQARQQKQANPATRQNPGIVYRNSMEDGKPYPVSQRATTPVSLPMRAHSSPGRTSDGAVVYQPTQYDKSRSVPGEAGTSEQRDNHPGAANYGTYAKPTWFDVEGSNGKVRVGYWDVDGTRQTLVRHGTFPERSQAQPQQPRGLHYVPGGWANDGYSFEGSAEDRARFFAPVSGPGRAPRSDNDTFLALQRQKAMQPVEQPLPERPEFPADRRMGWHTKLAKYQADMDAYNRQMANIAGYRQAMDVAALQQMPKPTDPVEQARLERALALQEQQAAQQSAYNQARLGQQNQQLAYQREQDAIKNAMGLPALQQARLGAIQAEDVAELRREYAQAARRGDKATMAQLESIIKMYGGGSDENSRKKDSPQFIPGKMNDDGSITPDRIFDPETMGVFMVPQQQAWSPDELNEAADNRKVIQAAIDRTGGKVAAELASALRATNGDPRKLRELRARVDQSQE